MLHPDPGGRPLPAVGPPAVQADLLVLADRGVGPVPGEQVAVTQVAVAQVAVTQVGAVALQTVAAVVRAVPVQVAQVTKGGEVVVTIVVTTPEVKHAAGQSRLGPGRHRVTLSIPVSGGSLL